MMAWRRMAKNSWYEKSQNGSAHRDARISENNKRHGEKSGVVAMKQRIKRRRDKQANSSSAAWLAWREIMAS